MAPPGPNFATPTAVCTLLSLTVSDPGANWLIAMSRLRSITPVRGGHSPCPLGQRVWSRRTRVGKPNMGRSPAFASRSLRASCEYLVPPAISSIRSQSEVRTRSTSPDFHASSGLNGPSTANALITRRRMGSLSASLSHARIPGANTGHLSAVPNSPWTLPPSGDASSSSWTPAINSGGREAKASRSASLLKTRRMIGALRKSR